MRQFLNRIKKTISNSQDYGFVGSYDSWASALEESDGYGSNIILEKCRTAMGQVKRGEKKYERDSVIFEEIQYSWPVLSALMLAATKNNNRLEVIDYGGSLGSTYYQNQEFLKQLDEVHWMIVEQENFVKCGQKHFSNEELTFWNSLEECAGQNQASAILLSGVLQYLEKPYETIKEILALKIDHIIIDRTSFLTNKKTKLTIQKVPPAITGASYPCWLFNEIEFTDLFKEQYRLVADYLGFERSVGEIMFKGFIYVKR